MKRRQASGQAPTGAMGSTDLAPIVPAPSKVAGRFNISTVILVASVASLLFLVGLPIFMLLYSSFLSAPPGQHGSLTFANYISTFTNTSIYPLISNSLIYAMGSAILSICFAMVFAFLIVRTNMPGRRVFETLILVPFFIPAFLQALSAILLYNPHNGLANFFLDKVFGTPNHAYLNAYSMPGLVVIGGLYGVTIAYLLMASNLRSMNPALEEAAKTSGSSLFYMFRKVTFPLMLPAVLSAFVLILVFRLASFELPYFLGTPGGIHVFITQIFNQVYWYPPNYGAATALSTVLLGIAVFGVFVYRRVVRSSEKYTVVTGKGYRPRQIDLGAWKWLATGAVGFYYFIVLIVPLFSVVLMSFLPYFGNLATEPIKFSLANYASVLTASEFSVAMENSIMYAGTAATGVLLLSLFTLYIVTRMKTRGSGFLEVLALLPIGLPSLVVAVGLIWTFTIFKVGIYGTPWIFIIAYMIIGFPLAGRFLAPAIIQIHKELEEASAVCGASRMRTIRSVLAPLLRPALFSTWIILFLILSQELVMSVMLYSPGHEVLSFILFNYFNDSAGSFSSLNDAAAFSVILVFIFGGILIIGRYLSGGSGSLYGRRDQ